MRRERLNESRSEGGLTLEILYITNQTWALKKPKTTQMTFGNRRAVNSDDPQGSKGPESLNFSSLLAALRFCNHQ